MIKMSFLPNLRLKESLGQAQGTISKSVVKSSRYIFRKIQNGLDILSFNGPNPPQVLPPHTFPRLNATYCLMDVDYLRPQGLRPWAPPYSLKVMNPDPDYLDEEYVQAGPSPSEFDVRQLSSPQTAPSNASTSSSTADEAPPLPDPPESPRSPSDSFSLDGSNSESSFWKEVELYIDERNTYNIPSVVGTDRGQQSPTIWTSSYCRTPHPSPDGKQFTLCEDASLDDEALLAEVIRAGVLSQRSRHRL